MFFYAPSGSRDPGIYGWAVVTRDVDDDRELYFRPTPPTDYLKMAPSWDGPNGSLRKIVDRIRGPMKQGTMWVIPDDDYRALSDHLRRWLGSAPSAIGT